MFWALKLLGWAKIAAQAVLDAVLRYPWQAALIVALCWGGWQYRRAERWSDAHDAKAAALVAEQDARRADREEWNARVAAANKARTDAIARSKELAHDVEEQHAALVADNAGLRAYIAAHRLRGTGTARADPVPAAGAAQDHATGVPEQPTANALVAVSITDLEACDGAWAYAISAWRWGQGLVSQGLAETVD